MQAFEPSLEGVATNGESFGKLLVSDRGESVAIEPLFPR